MTTGPTGAIAAKKAQAPTFCTDLEGVLRVRFLDPEVELAYQEELLDSGLFSRARRVLVLGGVGLMRCLGYGWGSDDALWTARAASLSITAFFLIYGLALQKRPYITGFYHGWVMLLSYALAALVQSLTTDRWSALVNPEECSWSSMLDGECSITGFMEAHCILGLSGLLSLSAFFTQLHTWHCFLLLNFAVPLYLGLAWGLGSLEHQLTRDLMEDSWASEQMFHHSLLAAELYLIGILTITSRRDLEIKDRRAFASAYLKLARREWELKEDRKAMARQNELEQRLQAIMTPQVSADDGAAEHHNTDSDSMQNIPHQNSASTTSVVSQRRSMRVAQSLLRSDKHNDSAKHSSSEGTQESGASKSKGKLTTPPTWARTGKRKSKDTIPEELPCGPKTVPAPPVVAPPEAKPPTASTSSSSSLMPGTIPHCRGANHLTLGPRTSAEAVGKPPNARLVNAMAGRQADWPRIRMMAERIRCKDYNLYSFFQDCVASFPELSLFTTGEVADTGRMTASGRSAEVEYQRTIGALFAVYWLLRLDLDGKEAFCYGVDDDWNTRGHKVARYMSALENQGSSSMMLQGMTVRTHSSDQIMRGRSLDNISWRRGSACSSVVHPREPPAPKLFSQMSNEEKRANFMKSMSWLQFSDLVSQAGCSEHNPDSVSCIMAILCLTSFHDIMKVEELLPVVQPDHGSYRGYKAGVTIQDHDAALAYVLEHYPEVLPSFGGLPPAAKELVIFSQGKMHFNHGWFVQAEAPPGIMLTMFKQVLAAGASPRHVGFYFFHWITDLAGAEATPLGGAEKFVLKFPHDILASFLWSMPFLANLVEMTETAVVESYLKERWTQLAPGHSVPTGSSAVARMRLAVMVQEVESTLQAFDELGALEQATLSEELARTGVQNQYYSECKIHGGPAFLVYYGPALIQQNCSSLEDLSGAMMVLGRVLIAARKLWPMRPDAESSTVTIQVGELKSRSLEDIISSPKADTRQVWVLIRQNDNDGAVMLRQAMDLNWLFADGHQFVILDFCQRSPFCIGEVGKRRTGSMDVGQKRSLSWESRRMPHLTIHDPPGKLDESGQTGQTSRCGSVRTRQPSHASMESGNTYEFMPCVPDHMKEERAASRSVSENPNELT